MRIVALFSIVACIIAASVQKVTADDSRTPVRGRVTDQSGAPLEHIVLIVDDGAAPDDEGGALARQWVRVGRQGAFEARLPAELILVGVLPGCYDVVDLKRTATDFQLVLSDAGSAGGPEGTGSAGTTTSFSMLRLNSLEWLSRSTGLSSFGTAAGLNQIGNMHNRLNSFALTAWRSPATYSSLYSTTMALGNLHSNLNTSLNRSWSTWPGLAGTSSAWRPGKGVHAIATPACEKWNRRPPQDE
jgi:hypothetical protein